MHVHAAPSPKHNTKITMLITKSSSKIDSSNDHVSLPWFRSKLTCLTPVQRNEWCEADMSINTVSSYLLSYLLTVPYSDGSLHKRMRKLCLGLTPCGKLNFGYPAGDFCKMKLSHPAEIVRQGNSGDEMKSKINSTWT